MRWNELLRSWGKDAKLWLFVVGAAQLFRVLLSVRFHPSLTQVAPRELALAALTGARFDAVVATVVVASSLFASGLVASVGGSDRGSRGVERLRTGLGYGFVALASFVFACDYAFVREFKNQLDHRVGDLYYDDTHAILVTIWHACAPVPLSLLAAVGGVLLGLGLRRWLARPLWIFERLSRVRSWPGRGVIVAALALAFATCLRGALPWRSPIRVHFSFVTDDLLLNRFVQNPFVALVNALEDVAEARAPVRVADVWPGGDLDEARRVAAPSQVARGASLPPRHVFLVLMESQDGWPLFPEYRHIGLAPGLSNLADRGVYASEFVASGESTPETLSVLVTGLPELGRNVTFAESAARPFLTAIAPHFRRLGYRTRFFFGGYLGWRRLDMFLPNQGFDEVWGAGSMRDARANTWGVRDETLFDFVLAKLDDSAPSLNVIVTTTNHSPYDLNLAELGFPLTALPAPLAAMEPETMKILAHYWYADRETARFVERAERKLPKSLFALTGDHTGRRGYVKFPGDNVVEHIAVPLILYGAPDIIGNPRSIYVAGSHLDIAPTLYERCAPTGFAYDSFGRDILQKISPSYGLARGWIAGEGFVVGEGEEAHLYRRAGELPQALGTPFVEAKLRFRAVKAVSASLLK